MNAAGGRLGHLMFSARTGLLMVVVSGCASSGGVPVDLPLIVPPVRAATPAGFSAAAAAARLAELDGGIAATDFRDRFFNPAGGPTEVFDILAGVDMRLAEINTSSTDAAHPCLEATPTEYTLEPFGQTVAFVAQCYRQFSGGSGPAAFMQFGKRDQTTYLYITGGAARVAARVVADDQNAPVVDVWYGVGYTNATCGSDHTFDGCSYAVTQIHADSATHAFEMTVAGIGVGFCGIQVRSDGASIFGRGSPDMGMTCNDAANLCVSASDLAMPGSCDALQAVGIPALGRRAGAGAHQFGASHYPDVPNITLDGTATDSLHFGPGDAPTAGVASFDK
jgi:hypothetical protein